MDRLLRGLLCRLMGFVEHTGEEVLLLLVLLIVGWECAHADDLSVVLLKEILVLLLLLHALVLRLGGKLSRLKGRGLPLLLSRQKSRRRRLLLLVLLLHGLLGIAGLLLLLLLLR